MEARHAPAAAPKVSTEQQEGIAFLNLIGRGHLANAETNYRFPDGTRALGRDFLRICGQKARPLLVGMSLLPDGDANKTLLIGVFQERCDAYFPDVEPGEQ
jgi:hypothetical protein